MEEVYTRPKKKLSARMRARAMLARAEARKPKSTKEVVQRARKRAQVRAERLSSQLLPDGLSPATRAKLGAAHRRAVTDPERVALLERAQLAKRVQLAKRESGIPDADKPMKFMGMNPKEFEQAVDESTSLPPAMTTFRKPSTEKPQKPAPKVPRKSKK